MAKQPHNALRAVATKIALMAAVFIIASAIGYSFRHVSFPDTNIVVVYLLSVHITAWLTRSFAFGFIASILSTFSFNYFFAAPHYSFSVNDPNYIITFITMTVTALVTSALTSHAKQSALTALDKETEAKTIYNLTNHLTGAKNICDIVSIAVNAISNCFSCEAACLCFDENGNPEHFFIQQLSEDKRIKRKTEDINQISYQNLENRKDFDIGPEFYDFPIYGSECVLGLIRMPKEKAQSMNDSQRRLLHSMIESAALAMDRFQSAMQRMKSIEEIDQERYRTNLLRSISHDLRTPLSSIIATSEMLLHMTEQSDPRYDMVSDIRKGADWLYSLVENILSLTRLQDGGLALTKQPEAVEEVIGGAVNHIAKRSPNYDIIVNVPHELLIVPMDARLIEQVIVNLLDNAVKHTKPENEISIVAELSPDKSMVKIIVKDSGTGIRENNLPHLFQMFYTCDTKHADVKSGIGLGLAICETIVKAHGGNIGAHNRTDGQGAEFVFTLPMGDDKND